MKARVLLTGLLVLAISAPAFGQAQSLEYVLTASPSSAVTGEPITVSFTAPPGSSASDWIGLYHTEDTNILYRCVHFTGGVESGSFVCDAAMNPGVFEFRYLVNGSYTSVAASNRITVEPATGFTLSLSDNATSGNGPITLTWTAPLGRPANDWIGLFKQGEVDNHNYDGIRWIYTDGATSGSHTFRMPTLPGKYVFRYLLRDSYVDVSESAPVTVTAFSVTAGADWVYRGAPMKVSFTAPAGQTMHDWIALYRVGEPASEYLWFAFTNGAATGSFTGDCELEPGTYEYRYMIDNGFTVAAESNPFIVYEPVGFALSVSDTVVPAGTKLRVSWIAPASGTSQHDWIGLFAVGADNRQWIQYVYTGGAVSGSATFKMPLAPGTYEFRYLLNDRFSDVAHTEAVIVQ
jgi:hypothetical protein